MKKFISMLAGVVMASSLFVATAYAAGNVSMSVDKTEVNVGEKVTVTINSAAKSIAVDGFNLQYDTSVFECVDILDDAGYSIKGEGEEAIYLFLQYKLGRNTVDAVYTSSTLEEAAKAGKVAFFITNGSDMALNAKDGFAQIVLEAKVAADTTSLVLNEDSAGADLYKGVCQTANVTVKGNEPPVDNNNYGTAGKEFEGKATKYWTVDFAEWTGAADISLSDGTDTKTINVTTADDSAYDIAGAVSFYVYVIGDAAAIENVYIVE